MLKDPLGQPSGVEHWTTLSNYVDIYLSAGPHLQYGSEQYKSCNANNFDNCAIYRVRWNLSTETADEVENVVDLTDYGASVYMPTLTPDGTVLAMRLHEGTSTRRGWILTQDLDRHLGYMFNAPTGGVDDNTAGSVRFPNWRTDNSLTFQRQKSSGGKGENTTLFYQNFERTDGVQVSKGRVHKQRMPDNNVSYADPNTHPNPPDYGAARTVVHGTDDSGTADEREFNVPRIISPTNSSFLETFDLPVSLTDGQLLKACHHPAWNITGDRILCGSQQTYHEHEGAFQRLLYGFSRADSSWVLTNDMSTTADTLFEPMLVADLESDFSARGGGSLFPQRDSTTPSCQIYTYKYAEWCGTDDYVVTTLFCSDEDHDPDNPIFTSRVMLVRLSTGQYWDITAAVEEHIYPNLPLDVIRGLSGGVHGVYATCAERVNGIGALETDTASVEHSGGLPTKRTRQHRPAMSTPAGWQAFPHAVASKHGVSPKFAPQG